MENHEMAANSTKSAKAKSATPQTESGTAGRQKSSRRLHKARTRGPDRNGREWVQR